MGLFKKNQTTQIVCPNCNTHHTVEVYTENTVYLDGTPQLSIEKLLSQCVVCNHCQLLCINAEQPDAKHILQNPDYQQALLQKYPDEVAGKLALLNAAYKPWYLASYYARYYHEQGDLQAEKRWLNIAIEAIVQGEDQHAAEYVPSELPQLKLQKNARVYMYADVRLVDLYRRAQRFDEAKAQIENIRRRRVMARPDFYTYLDFEEQLVSHKDSSLY